VRRRRAIATIAHTGLAERLFFTEMLESDIISASALAQQIHQSHSSFTQSATSVVTEDIVTDRGGGSRLSESAVAEHNQKYFSPRNDHGLAPPGFYDPPVGHNNTHSPFNSKQTMPASATETTMHVDPAENAYDAAKGVWAWGKGVFVMKHFLGIAEGVAGKVVSMAGSTLEDLDHAIMPRLQEWDDSILNPALQALVGTILGAVKKSVDIFKPVVFAILKPIGLIKEDDKKKSSEPELTAKPTMVK
jgi:hypothetical protein